MRFSDLIRIGILCKRILSGLLIAGLFRHTIIGHRGSNRFERFIQENKDWNIDAAIRPKLKKYFMRPSKKTQIETF